MGVFSFASLWENKKGEKTMKIDPLYHETVRMMEERAHRARLETGRPIRCGGTYRSILSRDGRVLPGPFLAAAWRDGTLLAAGEDRRSFALLHEDAAEFEGCIYTGALPGLIVFREEPSRMIRGASGREARCALLRRAAAVKQYSRLSREEAELLLDYCETGEAQ